MLKYSKAGLFKEKQILVDRGESFQTIYFLPLLGGNLMENLILVDCDCDEIFRTIRYLLSLLMTALLQSRATKTLTVKHKI